MKTLLSRMKYLMPLTVRYSVKSVLYAERHSGYCESALCQLLILCMCHSERSDDTVPTVGFTSEQVHVRDNRITLYDVGGGARIRDIWRNYFADVHGVIYVVDSSQPERLDESRTALEAVFKDPLISGKPCLM